MKYAKVQGAMREAIMRVLAHCLFLQIQAVRTMLLQYIGIDNIW